MSKALKIALVAAYAFILMRYLIKRYAYHEEDIQLDYESILPGPNYVRKRIDGKKEHINSYPKFQRPIRFPSDIKYVLKYTNKYIHIGTNLYTIAQEGFIEYNCRYYNCYLTDDINLFPDVRYFSAVLFDVEDGWDVDVIVRHPYQKYIFLASEPAAKFPICELDYNNYYNLTWTYKLDSDIKWNYFEVHLKDGTVVGPKQNMSWINPMDPTPQYVLEKISRKSKAAALISNCYTEDSYEDYAKAIHQELVKYELSVDFFGWCGSKTCPNNQIEKCLPLLQSDYYFYLSFENFLNEDFVTTKVLYALQNFAVPVVFGGADYDRFLPPGSYINAGYLNQSQVAEEIYKAIETPEVYIDYFRWHNHYEFKETVNSPDICKLCQILNEDAEKHTVHTDFINWWNDDESVTCEKTEAGLVDTIETIINQNSQSRLENPREKIVPFVKIIE